MTNNKVCTAASEDNEMHNQILRLEACDGRNLPVLTLGSWQGGKCTSKPALVMKGAVPSPSHDGVTEYGPLTGTDKF